MADAVREELNRTNSQQTAGIVELSQLCLVDSGASCNLIGRSWLKPAELETVYKVEPVRYRMAEGYISFDEALKLWFPIFAYRKTHRDHWNPARNNKTRTCPTDRQTHKADHYAQQAKVGTARVQNSFHEKLKVLMYNVNSRGPCRFAAPRR